MLTSVGEGMARDRPVGGHETWAEWPDDPDVDVQYNSNPTYQLEHPDGAAGGREHVGTGDKDAVHSVARFVTPWWFESYGTVARYAAQCCHSCDHARYRV